MTHPIWKYLRTMLPSVIMLLAAGWLMACSSDEDLAELPENPNPSLEKPIAFGSGSVGGTEQGQFAPAARSGVGLEKYLKEFTVWGYKSTTYDPVRGYDGAQRVFPETGYVVKWTENSAGTATDNTHDWHYVGNAAPLTGQPQTIKYWDFGATAYRFFAIAGDYGMAVSTFTGVAPAPATDRVSLWITNMDANKNFYFTHLWFSNNAPGMPEFGKPVTLTFFQPFCKVRFMFVGEDGKPLKKGSAVAEAIDANSILFAPTDDGRKIHSKADLYVHYPLAGPVVKESYQASSSELQGYVEIRIPYEAANAGNNYALLQPEKDADGNVVTDKDGNIIYPTEHWYKLFPRFETTECPFRLSLLYKGMKHTAIVPKEYTDWQVNTEYTYVFKITDMGVSFEPELFVHKEWETGYSTEVEW